MTPVLKCKLVIFYSVASENFGIASKTQQWKHLTQFSTVENVEQNSTSIPCQFLFVASGFAELYHMVISTNTFTVDSSRTWMLYPNPTKCAK